MDFGMGKNEEISLGLRQSHIEATVSMFSNKMDQFEIKGMFKWSLTTNGLDDTQFKGSKTPMGIAIWNGHN